MTTANVLAHTDPKEEREREQRPLDLRLMLRLWRYTKPYALKRNALFIIVIIRAIQGVIVAAAIGFIIKGPITVAKQTGEIRGVLVAAAAFGLWVMLTYVVMYFRVKFAAELGERVIHDLRMDLFTRMQRMTMSYYDHTKVGRIISRFTSDAEAVRVGIQNVVFVSMVNAATMFFAAALMAYLDWMLFTVVAVLAPILWAINRYFRQRISHASRVVQESFSRVTANLAETVSGIRVTQGFVRQEVNADMFSDLVTDHSENNMLKVRTSAMFMELLTFNTQVFLAALLAIGGWRVLQPDLDMDIGTLTTYFFLANLFFSPITSLGTQYSHALTAMAGAERVFKVLDLEPAFVDPPYAMDLPPLEGRVEFHDLSFEYEPGKPVLNHINFSAESGQTVALVGHTGSGKSSIINLISKFYLPTEGELLIDGYDIRGIKASSLHEQMGIVLQQNFLFTGTVMDNIRVGEPGATDEQIIEAAHKLDCLDLLESLPDGLYTQVGERGGALSLGQRQLVCFTRAMVADPRILILDEATSSVDTMTEARIQRALEVLLAGRTSFVVAHRLSTIRHASIVLVLDHGWIVERGTHNQLLATGGVYANLYRQFIRATEA